MKHIFLFLCSLLALVGCSSEDPITPGLTYGNDFVITDQPDDSIQHERYLLYKDFGVPVYFNDTIAKHTEGLGVDGKSRTTYETVDLNWTFSGYNRGVKYSYVYLTAPEDQMLSSPHTTAHFPRGIPHPRARSSAFAHRLRQSSRPNQHHRAKHGE